MGVGSGTYSFLHALLATACPMSEPDGYGARKYRIETHCQAWIVTAKKFDNDLWVVIEFEPEEVQNDDLDEDTLPGGELV